MAKYIDFALVGELVVHGDVHYEDLKRLPATDVQEVRHGRWVDGKCSVCRFDWHDIQYEKTKVNKSPYCPNCGAKMDEVEE